MNLFENDTDGDSPVDELLKELEGEEFDLSNRADRAGDKGSSELAAYYSGKAEGYEEALGLVKEYAGEETDEPDTTLEAINQMILNGIDPECPECGATGDSQRIIPQEFVCDDCGNNYTSPANYPESTESE